MHRHLPSSTRNPHELRRNPQHREENADDRAGHRGPSPAAAAPYRRTAVRPRRARHGRAVPHPLSRGGRGRHGIRHSRGHDPAGVRPDDGLQAGAPRAGPPRAGRDPRRRRLRPRDGQARRRAGHLGPRRDQRDHRHRRRVYGFDPAGGHHRSGGDQPDRHRRVPGSRHDRPHAPLHQA